MKQKFTVWFALLPLFLAGCMTPEEKASVGIIGGADGPTAIFVTSRIAPAAVAAAVVVLLMIVGAIAAIVITHKHK